MMVKKNERRGQSMLADAPLFKIHEPFFVLDKELRYVSTSPAYKALIQQSGKDILGKRLAEIHPDASHSPLLKALQQGSWDQPDSTIEDYCPRLKKWLEYHVSAQPNGFVVLIFEITAKKQQNIDLEQQEEVTRSLLEGSATGIALLGLDGRWRRMNHRFAEILGIDAKAPNQYFFKEFVLPAERFSAQKELTELVLGQREIIDTGRQLVKSDQSVIWVQIKITLVRHHDGRPRFFAVTLDDIAESKEAEESLQFALDAAQMGSWDYDAIHNTTRRSPRFDQIFGSKNPADDWGYEHFLLHVHPEDILAVEKTFRDALTHGKKFALECRIIHTDQSQRWISLRGRVYMNHQGRALRMAGIVMDITAQKAWEQEIQDAKKAAEDANREKSNFLANMSHEIRTPLGAILGFSEILTEPGLKEEEFKDYVKIINRNGQSLSVLIDDILDLSKVEAGHLEVEKTNLVLWDLMRNIETLFKLKAEAKGLKLVIEAKGPVPEKIKSDPTRLRQVLLNIVGNAIKFTSQGEVKITIQMRPNPDPSLAGELVFYISDTGLGISAEEAERLFQPFTQADSSTTRKFGGTGLGLALSRKLARALGGDVILQQSVPGQGSTFKVSILAEPVQEISPPAAEMAPTVGPKAASPVPLPGVNILVADDSSDNRLLISRILNKTGAHVDLAVDGCKAVEKAREAEYDIVVMDMQMPNLDGYEATRQLRGSGFAGPIIALTANAMRNDREKCLEAGCSDYLPKPIDPVQLYKVVGELIQNLSH
jgi:PAS domain S-box-containing protein